MPKSAVQPQWRSRRAAISKKGAIDYELLMENELVDFATIRKKPSSVTKSPVSIASTHLEFAPVPEMKLLPGAWVTVGKGGRPMRESLMYDEPAKGVAKKENKRIRAKIPPSENGSVAETLASLAEASMSSKCLQALGRSTTRREKALAQAKDTKSWLQYQQAKRLKILARDTLIAALADGGLLAEIKEGTDDIRKPEPLKQRNDKGSSRGAKARRKARFTSAAARCYSMEDAEDMPQAQAEHSVQPQAKLEEAKDDGWVRLKALKREREVWQSEGQSEGSSFNVDLSSATKESQDEIKQGKRQSGQGEAKEAKEAKKRLSKQCIIS